MSADAARPVLVVDDGGLDGVQARAWAREVAEPYEAPVHVLDRERTRASDESVALEVQRLGADLIVATGLSAVRLLAFVEATGAAVLIARELPPAGRIVCALDVAPSSALAAQIAVELAYAWDVRADIVHVVAGRSAPVMPINARHEAVQSARVPSDVRSVVVSGDPTRAILLDAERTAATLLMLGAPQGARDPRRQQVSALVDAAHGPVLVVPS